MEHASRPLAGILWMLLTGACFVALTVVVKHVGSSLPAPQSAFLRYALGLVFLVPLLRPLLALRLTRRQWTLFGLRGLAHTAGVILWFYSMTQITVAEVTAMNFVNPIYVTIGAALFLGEKLAARRIAAIGVAFLGALVILRPGFRDLGPGHLAMVFTAILMGASYLTMKLLSGQVPAGIIVALLSITVTIGLAPVAFAVWVPVSAVEVGWMALVAAFATLGHYAMTRAYAAAPVAVTQPVTFLQLLWAVLAGWLLFGEPVDVWVVLGGAMILGAVSFIAWREYTLKRRAVTPHAAATKM